jgi:hypothetical protein
MCTYVSASSGVKRETVRLGSRGMVGVGGCVFVRIRRSLCRGSSVCLEDIFDVLDDSFLCLMNVG